MTIPHHRRKAKGSAFEAAVVEFLRAHGFPRAARTLAGAREDRGDISGLPITVEVKNHKTMDLGGWMNEAQREAISGGTWGYAVIHKRVGKADVRESYVTMPLWYAAALLEGDQPREVAS